jgi:large subunit ribosomal protein L9
MQLILIDDVSGLGKRGEMVKVADGYGRNYLLPRRLAVHATPGNIKMVEQQRVALAKKEAKLKEEAQMLAGELSSYHILLSRKAGETGALFGSVTSKDLAELLETAGVHMDRRKILLDPPIKAIGNYNVEMRPHSDVHAHMVLSVLPEAEEEIAIVKKRDDESEKTIADLDAKVKELHKREVSPKVEEQPAAQVEPRPRKPKGKKEREEHPEAEE